MYRIVRYLAWAILLLPLLFVGYLLTQSCAPHSRAELRAMTDKLNEVAAVRVPHDDLMSDEMRQANAELIARVDRGEELSAEDSRVYREMGLQNLLENQTLLSYLDTQFQALTDVGMEHDNNVGGKGIAGRHDHHDASARANFAAILADLEEIKDAGFLGRIWKAMRIYKNSADLIIHMGPAPQSVSVPYEPLSEPWPDAELGGLFETFLESYKEMQFAPVNSEAYVTPLHRGLDAYDTLVYSIQSQVAPLMGWADCRIAGNWLSFQQVAPPLDAEMEVRFPRPAL